MVRLLIIEDDTDLREGLQIAFEGSGFDVMAAGRISDCNDC